MASPTVLDLGRALCGSPILIHPLLDLGRALLLYKSCRMEIGAQMHLGPQALPNNPLRTRDDWFLQGHSKHMFSVH